jgi:membrane protease YdiL (CAAX protease family)
VTAIVVMAVGAFAQVVSWRLVAARRVTVWTGVVPVLVASGIAAIATGRVHVSPHVSWPVAAVVGLGAGVAFFAATGAVVWVATLWPPIRRAAGAIYRQGAGLPLAAALLISLALAVPGEELFWRGLFQDRAADAAGRAGGLLLAWAGYVGMNWSSGTLPIAVAAVVGGAAWGALAFWTGGVLAPFLCHATWTGLMIARPPVRRTPRARV